MKGRCKYCHLPGHIIDKCPTILCKGCRGIGHPIWLCKRKGSSEKNAVSPDEEEAGLGKIYGFSSTTSLNSSPRSHASPKANSERKNRFVSSSQSLPALESAQQEQAERPTREQSERPASQSERPAREQSERGSYREFKNDFRKRGDRDDRSGSQPERHAERHSERHAERHSDRHVDRHADRHAERHSERQSERHSERPSQHQSERRVEEKVINIQYYQKFTSMRWGDLV